MFNETEIVNCLADLVQFENVNDPSYGTIDSSLIESVTGRLVSSAHTLATIENLFNVAPEFDKYNYPAWITGVFLKANTILKSAGALWRVRADIPALANIDAPTEGAQYEETNPFSAWLIELRNQSAIELISKLVEMKKLKDAGKTLLESLRLYEGGGLYSDRVINKGNFVGFEILLMPNENIQTIITQIGIQLDGVKEVPIYLYHSSIPEALGVTTVTGKGGLNFNWQQVKLVLKSVDYNAETGHDSGGMFYLGYYQADLGSVQALNKQFNIGIAPCSTCNAYNVSAFAKWSKRVRINAILVDPYDVLPDKTLFNITDVVYTPNYNYGLNLAISVNCDISNFICSNKYLFADSMAKMVALKCLQKIAFCTRLNAVAASIKNEALAELNTDVKSSSFYSEYMLALKALDIEFGGFDADCLPCANRRYSLTYGAI